MPRVLGKKPLSRKEFDPINQLLNIYDSAKEKKIIKGFPNRPHSSMSDQNKT